MRDELGRFAKGYRSHPETEFKKGEHWRQHKPYWTKAWLEDEYIVKQKPAMQIAQEWNITENAILFWLNKHNIPTRNMREIRSIKHWGLAGEKNGMYGRCGEENKNWKGGVTPERQAFYSSLEWADACKTVWKRDSATCQRCGYKTRDMHIHHIVSFAVRELRADPDNLVLLCAPCHHWVHSKKNIDREFIGKEVTG